MMAEPTWQETLRLRLLERNARENAFAPIIEQYRRLAQQTKLLKERNASLLRAVSSVKATSPSNPAVLTPGTSTAEDNPVRAAYMASLESQISSLRDELATVYKTQGQNAQRLLSMNETLREKEEASRIDVDNLRKTREEVALLRKKVEQHAELMAEKDRTAQVLHDEINTLQLELGQIEERNQILTRDNAKLLQRWLDAKQAEANKMNEANDFYEDIRSRHQAVLHWREHSGNGGGGGAGAGGSANGDQVVSVSTAASGNGEAREGEVEISTRGGIPSPHGKTVDLTPNG